MQLGKILEGYRVMQGFAVRKLPVRISYALSKNMEAFEKEVDRYEEKRLQLCKDLARKDENGEPVKIRIGEEGSVIEQFDIPQEEMKKLGRDLHDLQTAEGEVPVMCVPIEGGEKIDLDRRYSVVTPQEMTDIGFMISGG